MTTRTGLETLEIIYNNWFCKTSLRETNQPTLNKRVYTVPWRSLTQNCVMSLMPLRPWNQVLNWIAASSSNMRSRLAVSNAS